MRYKKSCNLVRNLFGIAILGILFYVGVYVGVGVYKESSISVLDENEISFGSKLSNIKDVSPVILAPIESVPGSYLNFDVIARLEVPKIDLDTNVLKNYTQDGMQICPAKFWGPEPNEIGNFCIAGHNYNKENMFNHLIDLQIGDDLFLTDNKNGKLVYTIYNIYKVKPQNTAPIEQETNGKRVVTLITCVNYSRNRLIVQAIEKNVEGN